MEEIEQVVDSVIDIEEYAKGGKVPPLASAYLFRVDKQRITVRSPTILGREILVLAQKLPPESFILRQIFAGGRSEIIKLEQIVDLRARGVEKFKTLPRDQTEG